MHSDIPGNFKKSLSNMSKNPVFLGAIAVVTVMVAGMIGCRMQQEEPLALEITAPQNSAEFNGNMTTVSGIVTPVSALVTVNGDAVDVNQDGTFSIKVGIEYGENTINVSASTEGQEMISKTMTVSRVLSLQVLTPQDKAEVAESPVVLRGIVSDISAAVTVNGVPVRVAEDGTFFTAVDLNYVKNTIIVQAIVEGKQLVTKVLDVTRILVLKLYPSEYGDEVTQGSIIVSGVVYPPTAVVTVNGVEIPTSSNGDFSTTVYLDYGENVITVNATDPVTKTMAVTRVLTMDITSPQDGDEITEGSVVVDGVVSDPAALVTINGEAVELADDGTFSGSVDLIYGENIITVTALAGGEETLTHEVTVTRVLDMDIIAPEDNGEFNTSPISVEGVISDPEALVTVNGNPVVAEDGSFAYGLTLVEGENTINISVVAGGEEILTREITVNYLSN